MDKKFIDIVKYVEKESRFKESMNYIHHGSTSVYDHSIAVAYMTFNICQKYKIKNLEDIVIGALLHDHFLYDWHIKGERKGLHGLTHAKLALVEAKKDMTLSDLSQDIILKHMFPLTPKPPKYIGSWIVSYCDKYCASQETLKGLKDVISLRRVI